MKLKKRNDCGMYIELTPCGGNLLSVSWDIGKDHYLMTPDASSDGQFFRLVDLLYMLLSKNKSSRLRKFGYSISDVEKNGEQCRRETANVRFWGNGKSVYIRIAREWSPLNQLPLDEELIEISFHEVRKQHSYIVKTKDLCYAIARAATEAVLKYGFYGYFLSTGSYDVPGDRIPINELLYLKALALDAMDVRQGHNVKQSHTVSQDDEEDGEDIIGTNLDLELELLQFEM